MNHEGRNRRGGINRDPLAIVILVNSHRKNAFAPRRGVYPLEFKGSMPVLLKRFKFENRCLLTFC